MFIQLHLCFCLVIFSTKCPSYTYIYIYILVFKYIACMHMNACMRMNTCIMTMTTYPNRRLLSFSTQIQLQNSYSVMKWNGTDSVHTQKWNLQYWCCWWVTWIQQMTRICLRHIFKTSTHWNYLYNLLMQHMPPTLFKSHYVHQPSMFIQYCTLSINGKYNLILIYTSTLITRI